LKGAEVYVVTIEAEEAKALMGWLLVESLSLDEAVSLAVGRVPILGRPFPPTFTPLFKAAESAVENGQLMPSNVWKSRTSSRYYDNDYIEPQVTQANFRAWLEKALPERLQSGAFFFLREPSSWSNVAEAEDRTEKPLASRERNTLLRIIRALTEMAKLPRRGATASVEAQLQMMGFGNPKEATIRRLLVEARALETDSKP
jgi:hypothetical protein